MVLDSKTIVVTGAGKGIGAAITERLVTEGARVCAIDVDGRAVRRLAERLGDRVAAVQGAAPRHPRPNGPSS